MNKKLYIVYIDEVIWIQADVRSDRNQLENGKYNLISGWFNKIKNKFLCVYNGKNYINHTLKRGIGISQ